MRRSWFQVMCVVVLFCVCWIVVHPAFDIEPTAFRFAAFAALTLFLLRSAFKFAKPALIVAPSWFLDNFIAEASPDDPSTCSLAPLRC
jgi:hypothetical protein